MALEECRHHIVHMAQYANSSCQDSLSCLRKLDPEKEQSIRDAEEQTDHEEDIIGTFLVKLSARKINESDSAVAAEYLKVIGDLERIADHSLNLLESSKEIHDKNLVFSAPARMELSNITSAVREILALSVQALSHDDQEAARKVEPLCQVITDLKEDLRNHHIDRLQKGECSIEAGFVLSDVLTNLERISDHCSNVAACVIDTAEHTLNLHESVRRYRQSSEDFRQTYQLYREKYALPTVSSDKDPGSKTVVLLPY